ncbi:MAG: hypothetical protein O3B95_04990 [Chloroflexi bacterium]|nr:hypothetical protein [Chloroflexota bacterium]
MMIHLPNGISNGAESNLLCGKFFGSMFGSEGKLVMTLRDNVVATVSE